MRSAGTGPRATSARLAALLLALTAAAVLDPAAAEAQWDKPIDWLIPCTALLEATWGADSRLCDDIHAEGRIKDTLDQASWLLESLGFGSPAISASLDLAGHMEDASAAVQAYQLANQQDPRCEDRYCAWLVYALEGFGAYSSSDQSLVLNPFRIDDEGRLEGGYPDGFGFIEVHELFHAVQYGYPGVEAAEQDEYIGWIIEGTAEIVARAVGSSMGLSVGSSPWFRTYDQPLHSPLVEDLDDPTIDAWRYGSWEFFDFLGDYLGSDLGIQYLDHLFQTLAPGQNNGLFAVEAAVHNESGKGLYEAFPEFVARRLVYPCYFSHLGTWKEDDDCADGPDNEHRFALTFPDTIRRLEHMAADVAANGYLVRMEVPEGKEGHLTIRVPPDQDEEYLHLIVDDERRDAPGIAGRRNEYTTVLPAGPHEFFVRLANVPRDLADADLAAGFDFTADDPAPIEFLLRPVRQCYWEVDVQGFGISGRYDGAGIRVLSTDRLSWLQLDSGFNSEERRPENRGPVTAVGLQLGFPLSEGRFDGDHSMVFRDNGMSFTGSEPGSVNLTTLNEDSTGQTNEIAGTFEAQFRGAYINKQIVRGTMTIRGRFEGKQLTSNANGHGYGCGSGAFRWFGIGPPGAGGDS